MAEQSPTVSIIVPCRDEGDRIETCIRSILEQNIPAGGFEVIVSDGMSGDETRSILTRLAAISANLRVIDNPGRIVSTGLNEAINIARGKIIIRMDAHTEYAPDYVQQCVNTLAETGADNVGGPWLPLGIGLTSSAIAAAFQSPFVAGGAKAHDMNYEGIVDTVYLGCWPRTVFERVGLFDEALVRNQDDEFNLRLTRAGGKIWQSPRIRSWYCPRASLSSLFKQYMQYGYWKVRVIQKHKVPAAFRHLIPGCFVFLLLLLPLLGLWLPTAAWAWLALVGTYVTCNLVASTITAARTRLTFITLLPAIFACYHIGYGYGFLRGSLDFIILKRKPHPAYSTLTRAPGHPVRTSQNPSR
jgi:succinoglycan biosynthesis protein ExoA